MKSEIIDSSTVTFEPITLKITIESEKELRILKRITEYDASTPEALKKSVTFNTMHDVSDDDIGEALCGALRPLLNI